METNILYYERKKKLLCINDKLLTSYTIQNVPPRQLKSKHIQE